MSNPAATRNPPMRHKVLLLPGGVLPKDLAYGALVDALGNNVTARTKDLEVYGASKPPVDFGLETEIEGLLREVENAGFERFHLVGYSAGGAISAAFVAEHPDRVLSLALLEPAWLGNEGLSAGERKTWDEFDRIKELPAKELMPPFVRTALAPGVPPPPPPPGPPPPWMASRPDGIKALMEAVRRHQLELATLRSFDRPVYYALGALSNPDYYGAMATRAGELFSDYTLDVFEDRHHFDPPHRIEPRRLAGRLMEIWDRAVARDGV